MRTSKTVAEAPAGESSKKKPGRAAPARGAKKPAGRAVSPRAPRKKVVAPSQAAEVAQMPDQAAIDGMVAEAAYYLAEKRAFAPGFEEQDWQAARDQIAAQLRAARNPQG
jgi:hypothetical protein